MSDAVRPLEVLLVEDNPDDALLVQEYLDEGCPGRVRLTTAQRLSRALDLLRHSPFEAVLLDLGLPDRWGLETFEELRRQAPDVPVVVLSGVADERLAIQAVREGAQDYLVKGASDGQSLIRAIRYAIERKRIEVELAQARDEALEYSRMKAAFLASVTHELRTPLHGILGFGRLLSKAELSAEQQREFADLVVSSGEALLRLVNDILDLSKVEAGRLDLEEVAFRPEQVVADVAQLLRLQAEERGIELVASSHPRIPGLVRGDPGRLRQVLLNLVANAIKFTDHGRVTIAIAPEQERLRFVVRDSGVGIPLEAQQRIFEPFVQVAGSCGAVGTGLGLAIARHLVTEMGGEIGVESWPGQGSSFWFALPLAVIEAAPTPAPAPPAARARRPVPRDASILVADDDRIGRRLLEHLLSSEGHHVVTVNDGQAALEATASEEFDIVFLDSRMPRLNGPEVARQLRLRAGRHIPLVGLTADARKEERERCLAAGMDDFLSKPVDFEDLELVLERWLGDQVPEAALDWNLLEDLRERLGRCGSQKPFRDTLEGFLGCVPERLEALQGAIRDQDRVTVRRVAHQLRGACACLGARRMADLCRQLEVSQGHPIEVWQNLGQEFERFARTLESRGWTAPRPPELSRAWGRSRRALASPGS